VLISVTAVLMFGEVIPQAICSKHGLAIGHYVSPLVWVFIALLFPVSYPISKVLDWQVDNL
jgi:metal transporter CNNM